MLKYKFISKLDSTYAKVITLLSFVSISLLVLVGFLYFYTIHKEDEIYQSSNEVYKNEINSLVKLNSENYSSLIVEITYWDEFVNFVKTKDLNWFNSSIASNLDNYKVEYICAYDTESNLLTQVATPKIKSKNFIPKEAISKLLTKKIDKFYLNIPEGIVEIYGATIHPSNDPYKNKTKPSGCFFMVRLLDNEYFSNFEKISSSTIQFYNGINHKYKAVTYLLPLKNYNNTLIKTLFFKRDYNIDFWVTKSILLIITIALILSWCIYYHFANKWSKLPLSFIKKILKNNDQSAIQSLKNIKGEFRYIGKLFEENQIKNKELEFAKIKAEESDKLKTAFLMNLSHEIRTPMNAILGFSELLNQNNLTEKERKEYVNIIKTSGKNLVEIIDDLVEMSKIDSNNIKPNYTIFNINEFINYIKETYELSYSNSNVNFKIETNIDEFPLMITDKVKVQEIICNLLNNAFKFTNKGFVNLTINLDANELNVSVQDSGQGIPKSFQENVFKRFSKINSKGISANEGLGLGLAISKAYTDMLKGTISFKSQEAFGTTFFLTLPVEYANMNEAIANESQCNVIQDLGEEEIILVAEDDNVNFLLIERLLTNLNFKIIRAHNGEEAVQLLKANDEIDLILMDIKMPVLNGYEAFQEIRKFNSTIPIIAQTSYSFEEELLKIKELGFSDFITKPIDKLQLTQTLSKFIKF